MPNPEWWQQPWLLGSDTDPDTGWEDASRGDSWAIEGGKVDAPEAFDPVASPETQMRSRDRVRDLAEVFTNQREIDAMLDMMTDAFDALDVKFLEPACGSGNFLTEILRRKLRLVHAAECATQEHYEHRLLRAAASIYGVDISAENIAEARARMGHVILSHYQADANTVDPTAGFLSALIAILGANIVTGDTLNSAHEIELCDWRPHPGGHFKRVWSAALVPPDERDLFWAERVEDTEPVHYSKLAPEGRNVEAAPR